MMKKIFRRIERRLFVTAACVILMLAMNLTTVFAATANIIFDNSPYSATYQDSADANANKLSFDVSINCDEKPGTYYLELVYDTNRLQYTGGADKEEQGVLVLEGTATSSRIVYTLNFDVKSGGNAGIYVQYADIVSADGSSKIDIGTRDYGTITIQGTDISGAADFGHNVSDINSKIPFLGKVSINGAEYYITDQSQYIPDTAAWTYTPVAGTFTMADGQTKDITYLTGSDQQMRFLYLMDGAGVFHLFAVGTDGTFYPCVESDDYFYVSALAGQALPDGMTAENIAAKDIVYLQYKDGTGKFVFKNADGDFEIWSAESMNAADQAADSTVSAENSTDAKDETKTAGADHSGTSGFPGNLSPRFIIVILAILFVIVLIVLLVVKSGGKDTGAPADKKRDNNNQNNNDQNNKKKNAQNNKVPEEEGDDDGLRLDDIEALFSSIDFNGGDTQAIELDDSLKELENSLEEADDFPEEADDSPEKEEVRDFLPERTEDLFHEKEIEERAAEFPKKESEKADRQSLIEKLKEIQDEPGAMLEDAPSFTANLRMNLAVLEELANLSLEDDKDSEGQADQADE